MIFVHISVEIQYQIVTLVKYLLKFYFSTYGKLERIQPICEKNGMNYLRCEKLVPTFQKDQDIML